MTDIWRSEEINELAGALAKAQGSMQSASFDRENPHFRSRYASLASAVNAGRKALSENGIAVSQLINSGELTTLAMHTSGQWLKSVIVLPATPRPQEFGSALTYYRRYAFMAMVGIAPDDDDADDDGNVAEAAARRPRAPPKPGPNVIQPPGYKLSTGGQPHDPETGEVAADDTSTSSAGPAASGTPDQTTGAAGSLSAKAVATIQAMALEAAKMGGREQLALYYRTLPEDGKRVITAMEAELKALFPAPVEQKPAEQKPNE
jgi:hypothetical protein